MNRTPDPARYRFPLIVIITIGTFILSCNVSTLHAKTNKNAYALSITAQLLGECRLLLSNSFLMAHDTYFHRGVGHAREEAFENHFFQKLDRKISPREHVHLEGYNTKELMPWLKFAIGIDPKNLNAFLLSAFTLENELSRPDLAFNVLCKAQLYHPYSYEVYLDKGRLLLKLKRMKEAKTQFEAGLSVWNRSPVDHNSKEALLGLETLLLYDGLIEETEGNNLKAVNNYKYLLRLHPDHPEIKSRINDLEAGRKTAKSAMNLLDIIVSQKQDLSDTCQRTEAHSHEDHHHE